MGDNFFHNKCHVDLSLSVKGLQIHASFHLFFLNYPYLTMIKESTLQTLCNIFINMFNKIMGL